VSRRSEQTLEAVKVERALVGCVLADQVHLPDLHRAVGASDAFMDGRHKAVWEAMIAYQADGHPADDTIFMDWLATQGLLDACGGVDYLTSCVEDVVSLDHAQKYAAVVADKYHRRRMVALFQNAARDIEQKGTDPNEAMTALLDKAYAESDIRGAVPMDRVSASIEQTATEGVGHIPTGFASLDGLILGMVRGTLTVIGARPSQGKTALAVWIAYHAAADQGVPVYFSSLEMPKEQIVLRLACGLAEVSVHRALGGQLEDDEIARLKAVRKDVDALPIYIDDEAGVDLPLVAGRVRAARSLYGIGLHVVDYIQRVGTGHMQRANRYERVAAVSAGLKKIAKDLDIPVLSACMVGRSKDRRKKKEPPTMEDLRESADIEADADTILLLHNQAPQNRDTQQIMDIDVLVPKQRNGPTGERKLRLEPTTIRFFDDQEDLPFEPGSPIASDDPNLYEPPF